MAGGEMLLAKEGVPHSAKYTAATWEWAKLRCADVVLPEGAKAVFFLVNTYMLMYRTINPKKHSLPHMLLHRHLMINHLLAQSNCAQVIEVAAGFSPRGAALSEIPSTRYFEVDLPPVVALKAKILGQSDAGSEVLLRKNFRQVAGDIMEIEFFEKFEMNTSFVISEGLMMYFTRSEQMFIWKKVAEFLSSAGGKYVFDYIPVDVEPNRSAVGKMLHRLRNRYLSPNEDYCYDERDRWQIREDLLESGFRHVEIFESERCAVSWNLPYAKKKTKVLVYECC